MEKRQMMFLFLAAAAMPAVSACGALPGDVPELEGTAASDITASTVSDEPSTAMDPDSGSATHTHSTVGTEAATQTSGTDSTSDTIVCEPNVGTACSFDGRQVVWIDSCGGVSGVVQTCPVAGVCVSDDAQDPPTARCKCAPGLAEPSCEERYCLSMTSSVKSCQKPTVIGRARLPALLTGDLALAKNNVDVACGPKAQAGMDKGFALYLFPGEVFVASLETPAKAAELSLSVFEVGETLASADCTVDNLAECSDGPGGKESLSYNVLKAGWYVVVLDSKADGPANIAQYELTIRIENPKQGECYNSGTKRCMVGASVERDWASAAISPPMKRAVASIGEQYLYTTVAQSGTASATVTIPCDGYFTIEAWGWTPNVVSTELPSTFNLSVGPYENALLELGSTAGNWQKIPFPGGPNPVGFWLSAGNQKLVVRGGESKGEYPTEHPGLGPLTFSSTIP
ncbi:MAG: hypothetical protein MUC50_09725 [Myxococcota bacterium]|jgi:hypothetical protein|nr:hypothetical protein [Myxococcota bacterium]